MNQLPIPVQREVAESLGTPDLAGTIHEALDNAFNSIDWGPVGYGGNAPASYSGGLPIWDYVYGQVRGREDGRFHPFYESEQDLLRMRSACRRLATFSAIATGALKALQVYVIGGDWEYVVEPKEDAEPSEALVAEVQKIVDELLERNDFQACLDSDIHDAAVEDGEALLAGYAAPDGLTDLRLLSADNLREPREKSPLNAYLDTLEDSVSWSFGVHTGFDPRMNRVDHVRHLGYHVVWDDGGIEWDYLPAWPQMGGDMQGKFGHLIRRNVPQYAKRGVSDFFPVMMDIEREDKLNENTSVGAAIQAAIAWIEEMPVNNTKDQVEDSLNNSLDTFSQKLAQRSGQERTARRFKAGSIPVVSAGKKYHAGPMGANRNPIYIEVRQALIRRIEARWLMPEYMIAADASNANYASSLVAEAPFVKAREADQQRFVSSFRKLLNKCLKIACDYGRFRKWGIQSWQDLEPAIEIVITPSPVASRDKTQLLNELFGMYDRQIMDANEVRTQLKHEPKEELEGQMGMLPQQGDDPESDGEREKPRGDGERTKPKEKLPKQEAVEVHDVGLWEGYP